MTSDDFARQSQFDFLYNGIKEKYPGLFSQQRETLFQFMEMPMEADWTSGTGQKAFELADTVPAKLGGFYATGAGRVSIAYRSLLESMYAALGDRNSDYRTLKDKVQTSRKRLETKTRDAMLQYQAWRQRNLSEKMTFSEWLEGDPMGMNLGDEIQELRAGIKKDNAKCERIEGAMGKALSTAQDNLSTDVITLEDGRIVPHTKIEGNLQDDIARWKSAKSSGEYDLNVLINKNQTVTTPWHETIETKASAASCHAVTLESYVNVSRMVLDTNYSLTVKAVGLQGYPVFRGNWYNDAFVTPDIQLAEGATLKTEQFFGEQGSLHLIPTAFLVIYHPVLELTVSTRTYEEQIENNAKLRGYPGPLMLFGLNFDVSASYKKGVEKKQDTTTMTIVPPENQAAQILGVTSVNKIQSTATRR